MRLDVRSHFDIVFPSHAAQSISQSARKVHGCRRKESNCPAVPLTGCPSTDVMTARQLPGCLAQPGAGFASTTPIIFKKAYQARNYRYYHVATNQGLTGIGECTMANQSEGAGCLVVFVIVGYLAYLVLADNPHAPDAIDSSGYISHKVESTITAQANWMVGETKDCTSYPLDARDAVLNEKPKGYAFLSLQCDDGPPHKITITFWGAENQPGKTAAEWNCTRTSGSFVCRQTGAYAGAIPQ